MHTITIKTITPWQLLNCDSTATNNHWYTLPEIKLNSINTGAEGIIHDTDIYYTKDGTDPDYNTTTVTQNDQSINIDKADIKTDITVSSIVSLSDEYSDQLKYAISNNHIYFTDSVNGKVAKIDITDSNQVTSIVDITGASGIDLYPPLNPTVALVTSTNDGWVRKVDLGSNSAEDIIQYKLGDKNYKLNDIVIHPDGNSAYVSLEDDHTIRELTFSDSINSDTSITTTSTIIAGQSSIYGHTDSTGLRSTFNTPKGLELYPRDNPTNLLIADSGNNLVRSLQFISTVKEISYSGTSHMLILFTNGLVGVRGNNEYGRLGINIDSPWNGYFPNLQINPYLSNIRKVYATQFGSYFIDQDNNVYACGSPRQSGSNSPLQGLDKSPAPYNNVIYPQQITSLTDVKSLSIRSWGDNNGGVVLHMDGTISSWTDISEVGHQQSLGKVTDISGNPIEDVVVACGTNYHYRRNIQGNNVFSFGMNDMGQ